MVQELIGSFQSTYDVFAWFCFVPEAVLVDDLDQSTMELPLVYMLV